MLNYLTIASSREYKKIQQCLQKIYNTKASYKKDLYHDTVRNNESIIELEGIIQECLEKNPSGSKICISLMVNKDDGTKSEKMHLFHWVCYLESSLDLIRSVYKVSLVVQPTYSATIIEEAPNSVLQSISEFSCALSKVEVLRFLFTVYFEAKENNQKPHHIMSDRTFVTPILSYLPPDISIPLIKEFMDEDYISQITRIKLGRDEVFLNRHISSPDFYLQSVCKLHAIETMTIIATSRNDAERRSYFEIIDDKNEICFQISMDKKFHSRIKDLMSLQINVPLRSIEIRQEMDVDDEKELELALFRLMNTIDPFNTMRDVELYKEYYGWKEEVNRIDINMDFSSVKKIVIDTYIARSEQINLILTTIEKALPNLTTLHLDGRWNLFYGKSLYSSLEGDEFIRLPMLAHRLEDISIKNFFPASKHLSQLILNSNKLKKLTLGAIDHDRSFQAGMPDFELAAALALNESIRSLTLNFKNTHKNCDLLVLRSLRGIEHIREDTFLEMISDWGDELDIDEKHQYLSNVASSSRINDLLEEVVVDNSEDSTCQYISELIESSDVVNKVAFGHFCDPLSSMTKKKVENLSNALALNTSLKSLSLNCKLDNETTSVILDVFRNRKNVSLMHFKGLHSALQKEMDYWCALNRYRPIMFNEQSTRQEIYTSVILPNKDDDTSILYSLLRIQPALWCNIFQK